MSKSVFMTLLPLGKRIEVAKGSLLQDTLFEQGVEFPCGGNGKCKGCRIRVLEGIAPATSDDRDLIPENRLEEGWRLGCRLVAQGDLVLELAQWQASILGDDSMFDFVPREGYGIAIDLGTTTIVAQLIDLKTGRVKGVRSGLNAQGRHGADIMSRIEFGLRHGGREKLTSLVRAQVGVMIDNLIQGVFPSRIGGGLDEPGAREIFEILEVVFVGNSVMHHLFCGLPIESLSEYPFVLVDGGMKCFEAGELGWVFSGEMTSNPTVRFLPCIAGFVGSDIVAGILATELCQMEHPCALVDLGTNGEMVVGNRERLVCASTAAGPAFEGARISMGMQAVTGAISRISVVNGELSCHVLGGAKARGLCGSGLVDAVAVGLDLGWIQSNGRMADPTVQLQESVFLHQCDVRELQLAKGAIGAGLRILAREWGIHVEGLDQVWLAGAFGNYVSTASAVRIGLLRSSLEKIVPSGNTALRGAKIALCMGDLLEDRLGELLDRVEHIQLQEDPDFLEGYVEEMGYPKGQRTDSFKSRNT